MALRTHKKERGFLPSDVLLEKKLHRTNRDPVRLRAKFLKNHSLPQLFSIYYKVLDSLWTMKVTSLQFKMKKEWSASPFLIEFISLAYRVNKV